MGINIYFLLRHAHFGIERRERATRMDCDMFSQNVIQISSPLRGGWRGGERTFALSINSSAGLVRKPEQGHLSTPRKLKVIDEQLKHDSD
jgi:hypothetical protein